ncbi:Gastrula zinc finger xFG20-1 [Olea europaea subsp. europaea]|uniref:Gastrula zinc finger xFG20-1 n=1 Tax=Olea europaea subsp. europaea TaxID=158383 RepID=A0A8S0RLY7_OLEEU|nr:Gastrula zinc finger xFG20-1 [Olea europaea subsp. europaea]
MANFQFRPFFSNFFSIFILLFLHLGCFIVSSSSHHHHQNRRKRKRSPDHHQFSHRSFCPPKALSSSWSFIKRIFSSNTISSPIQVHKAPSIPSPSSSTRSLRLNQPIIVHYAPPETRVSDSPLISNRPESDISSDQHFFPLRNNIYPCPICGEIFQKSSILEQHQSTKHAVSELIDGDTSKNVVRIIFKTGWPDKAKEPIIHRILKIHNSPKILARFEEYRECVKSKAAKNGAVKSRDERCIADGNELLRFHCATYTCDLGQNGNSTLCNQLYCGVCGIVQSGFSPKLDGISTLLTSWRAHVAIPEEMEQEFEFMHMKRAMLVCRVIAGRVGSDPVSFDKDDPGFDSLVGRATGFSPRLDDEDELLVFNPTAVLPCFVIEYTV